MSAKKTTIGMRSDWETAQRLDAEQDGFTAYELGSALQTEVKLVYPIINGWREMRAVELVGKRVGRNLYKCVSGARPQFHDRLSSSRSVKPIENMWFAMRRLKIFSHLDIQMHANTTSVCVTQADARKYCQLLAEAGYLRVKFKATEGRVARYQLIKDTGPTAPKERKVSAIFDPNVEDYTYVKGVIAL